MDSKHSNQNASAWELPSRVHAKLGRLLQSPSVPLEQVLEALNELARGYFQAEEATKGTVSLTPSAVNRRIAEVLEALRHLETEADATTDQLIQAPLHTLRKVLEDRQAVLKAQPHCRKTDARAEPKRVLCGYINCLWQRAAHQPGDTLNRRHFAMLFLDAAGIDHPGHNNPERLDEWLDTSVGSIPPGVHERAAENARSILKS